MQQQSGDTQQSDPWPQQLESDKYAVYHDLLYGLFGLGVFLLVLVVDWVKAHWKVLVLFGVSLGYFIALTAPDLTWTNTGCDGAVYLRSAKYFAISHPWGAPLFNILNMGVVRIPLGSEFWRLAMVSAVCSAITAVLLYMIARRYTSDLKAFLAPLIWLGSALVVSQSTIIETYSLVTLLMVLAYYLHITGHPKAKYLIGAAGIAVHHLIAFVLLVILIEDLRKYGWKQGLKYVPLLFLGAVPYIYIPLANSPPFYWIQGTALGHYINYFFNQVGLVGGLAIAEPDAILRVQDFIGIVPLTFGIGLLLIVPAILKRENIVLTMLFLLPVLYYATDLAPQTYVYMMPAVAFGGLLAIKGAIVVSRYRLWRWLPIAVVVGSLVMMVVNVQFMDIGRTTDREGEAQAFYQSLGKMPQDCTIWIPSGGWGRAVAWLYNSEQDADILALPIYGHSSDWNREQSVIALQEGKLYRHAMTNPREHGGEIIAVESASELPELWVKDKGIESLEEGQVVPVQLGWASSYSLIRGEREIERWGVATESSPCAGWLMVFALGSIGSASASKALAKRYWKKSPRWIEYMGMGIGIGLMVVLFSLAGMELAI